MKEDEKQENQDNTATLLISLIGLAVGLYLIFG